MIQILQPIFKKPKPIHPSRREKEPKSKHPRQHCKYRNSPGGVYPTKIVNNTYLDTGRQQACSCYSLHDLSTLTINNSASLPNTTSSPCERLSQRQTCFISSVFIHHVHTPAPVLAVLAGTRDKEQARDNNPKSKSSGNEETPAEE